MEQHKVIRSAFLVGSFTSLSRALGLVRDFLTAGFFGTSLAMSAFVVAFRIPNLFRALFGEGALSSAFIPVFMTTRKQAGEGEAWKLARKVISLVGLVLTALVLIGVLGMTLAIHHPGLGAKTAMILPLARIMLPYMLFICFAALAMAILNSYGQFAVSASTPSLLNLVWIVVILLIVPRIPGGLSQQIFGVAWGVFAAGLIQLMYQIPALMRYGYKPGFQLDLKDPRVLRVFMLMGPAALGLAVTQVNVLVNSLLAVWIGTWAPAALFYAERLIYFPQGILATALSTVLLPTLSSHAAESNHARIRETISHSLRTLLFVMAPAAVGLLMLAYPIVQMIFEWHRFTPESTLLTARALQFYAPGLFVFCLAKVFVPAFYALQDTRTPVRIGLMSVALNFSMNVLFILTLPLYYKHAGLALATVLSEAFNGLMLARMLQRKLGALGLRDILLSAGRALGAALVMGAAALFFHGVIYHACVAQALPEKVSQIVAVIAAIVLGGLVYSALAFFLRYPEIRDVMDALRARRARRAGATR